MYVPMYKEEKGKITFPCIMLILSLRNTYVSFYANFMINAIL